MLEESLDGLALIISSVSSLSNLLEEGVLELADSSRRHLVNISTEAPNFCDCLAEVSVSLPRQNTIPIRIKVTECLTGDHVIADVLADTLLEFVTDLHASLFPRGYTGVLLGSKA
jgi:hypothetical protein